MPCRLPPRRIGPAIASSSGGRPAATSFCIELRVSAGAASSIARSASASISAPEGACDRDRLVPAALEPGVAADGAERPLERRRRQRDRSEHGELVPEQRDLVGANARVQPGRLQLGGDVLGAGQVDEEKRRELADVGRRSALGLDADRPRDHVRGSARAGGRRGRRRSETGSRPPRRPAPAARERAPTPGPGPWASPRGRRRCDRAARTAGTSTSKSPSTTLSTASRPLVVRERLRPHDQDDVGAAHARARRRSGRRSADAEDRVSHRLRSSPRRARLRPARAKRPGRPARPGRPS